MANTISKKPILIAIALCALLSLILAGSAYAVERTVYIDDGDGPVYSDTMASNSGVSYDGYNSLNSGHVLYISIEERTGTRWVSDTVQPMGIGQSASGHSQLTDSALWRVKLNPTYGYTDCIGYGTISD